MKYPNWISFLVFASGCTLLFSASRPAVSEPETKSKRSSDVSSDRRKGSKKLIQGYIKQLQSSSYDKRNQATRKLIEAGDAALPVLKKHINADNPEVRSRVRQVLNRMGKWSIIPGLLEERARLFVEYLNGPAYHKLRMDKNSYRLKIKLIKKYNLSYSVDQDTIWKKALIKYFREAGVRSNLSTLFIEPFLLKTLDLIGKRKDSEQPLKNFVFYLRLASLKESIPVFRQLITHENSEIKILMLNSLSKMGAQSDVLPQSFKETLIQFFKDPDQKVQLEARKLAPLLGNDTTVSLLLKDLMHENGDIRFQAYYGLKHLLPRSFEYNAWWSAERRRKAAKKLRQWWKKNKDDVKLK